MVSVILFYSLTVFISDLLTWETEIRRNRSLVMDPVSLCTQGSMVKTDFTVVISVTRVLNVHPI